MLSKLWVETSELTLSFRGGGWRLYCAVILSPCPTLPRTLLRILDIDRVSIVLNPLEALEYPPTQPPPADMTVLPARDLEPPEMVVANDEYLEPGSEATETDVVEVEVTEPRVAVDWTEPALGR